MTENKKKAVARESKAASKTSIRADLVGGAKASVRAELAESGKVSIRSESQANNQNVSDDVNEKKEGEDKGGKITSAAQRKESRN